ncbi:MAG: TadA family conjugal transfer-associated ATPase [Actinomycetaceae bacterium]|nr:TadA family conjugal transfer-associated ATPase [Arcanobacterium sp.]MDD7505645.1 TadA family conjugal transfer-associated ATPase [Actinomycetaceae bacterium]MDY6143429.1 TadA family conjugal transfer-associated ATPase [Arcanobacterium sp.]
MNREGVGEAGLDQEAPLARSDPRLSAHRGVSHELARIRAKLAQGANEAQALDTAQNVVFTEDLALLRQRVRQELMGTGATIAPLLDDPRTTDVTVNGAGEVWVDRGNGMERVDAADPQLTSEEGVRSLAMRLAATCGQRLDDASPIVDGTFPSGLRLHAVLPPLSAQGTLISLRTHRAKPMGLSDLVANEAVGRELEPVLRALINARANVMISGATGAGKTTILNAMLSLCGENERLLIIEESAELRPVHPHVVHLQVRRANVQGVGEVTMSELVRAAMRMRPDRLVLGECRGVEVRDVLGALNTGHEGGWATIHANSAVDVPARLVALGALAGMNEETVAAQASAALDAVIHVRRSRAGGGFGKGSGSGMGGDPCAGDLPVAGSSAARGLGAGGAGSGLAEGDGRQRVRWVAQIARLKREAGTLVSEPAFTIDEPGGIVEVGPGAVALCDRLDMSEWLASFPRIQRTPRDASAKDNRRNEGGNGQSVPRRRRNQRRHLGSTLPSDA